MRNIAFILALLGAVPQEPQEEVWTCEKPSLRGKDVRGDMDEGKWLAPFSVSASGVSFSTTTPDELSGKVGWTGLEGGRWTLRVGQKLKVTMNASNMAGSFRAFRCANGKMTFGGGVRHPYPDKPGAEKAEFEFVFQPEEGADKVWLRMEANPTRGGNYNSTGGAVVWVFTKGAGKPDAKKPAMLHAVDARQFKTIGAGAKERIGLPLQAEPGPARLAEFASHGSILDGVAADGVSLVLVRSQVAKPGKAHFAVNTGDLYPLVGDPFRSEGSSTLQVATKQLGEGQHAAFALYRPPSSFGRSEVPASELRFGVTYILDGADDFGPKGELTLKLVRPPVVLVHGTYDNPKTCYEVHEEIDETPMNLAPKLRSIGFENVFCVDWEETNGSKDPSDFMTNQHTVWKNQYGIRDALGHLRSKRIAVTQVDMVCHSQGGVIARVYAQGYPLSTELPADHPHFRDPAKCADLGCWYHRWDNYNLGDIHRLITISSTHKGSAVCRLFVAFERYYGAVLKDPTVQKAVNMACLGMFVAGVDKLISGVTTGGFYDQVPWSERLQAIGATPIPAHAIACVCTDEDMWKTRPDLLGMGDYYAKLYKILVGTPNEAKVFALTYLGEQEKKRTGDERPLQNAAKFKELDDKWSQAWMKGGIKATADWLKGEPTLKQRLDDVIFHLRRTVFLDEENDCTVALSSSYGGLKEPYTTKAEHVLHGWAPRYRFVQNRVIELLCNDGSLFDPDGFPSAYSGARSRASTFLPDAKIAVPGKDSGDGPRANVDPGLGKPETHKPAVGEWSGSWNLRSSWGETIVLTQTGNQVTATFGGGRVSLKGTVEGRVLKFRCTSANEEIMHGEFTLGADGKSFKGTYIQSEIPDTPLFIEAKK